MKGGKLWFKAKKFGWGWQPVTWQGWTVVGLYVFTVLNEVIYIENHATSGFDGFIQFFPQIFILTIFLLMICYLTGETPRWRWGKSKDEMLDVLNEQGEKTGKVSTRNDTYKKGYWSAAADVFVVNSKNELLMQFRSKQKLNNPEKWDISAGGRVDAGETPLDGAMRETKEEIGLTFKKEELTYIGTVRESEIHGGGERITNVFSSAYVIHRDVEIAQLKLQVSEVSEVAWVSVEELKKRIAASDQTLCPHPAEYSIFLDYMEKKYGTSKK